MPFSFTEDTIKLDLPDHLPGIKEGDWVEISTAYTAAMRIKGRRRALTPDTEDIDHLEFRQAILEMIVRETSDQTPITPEFIESWHPFVQDWVANEFFRLSAGRDEDEKKGSADNSSSSSAPPATRRTSLVSSHT